MSCGGWENGVKESDVYSFAVLLYSLFADPLQSVKRAMPWTVFQLHKWISSGQQLPRPPNVPHPLWELIAACWHRDRHYRPSFADIVEWLNGEEGRVFPGTDANQYREYRKRLMEEVEEDSLPFELLDAVETVFNRKMEETQ
jgi:hypothetical protein